MQSYLLPYHVASSGAKIVLMGRKNIIGYKAKGKTQTQPIVWNNAGQWVISGGGKDATDSDELKAAMREFSEETGVDLRVRNVREKYGYHNIETLLFPLSSSSKDFSVSYIQFEDYSGLSGQITDNIRAGNVADDELYEVAWIGPDAAKKLLGSPQVSTSGWMQAQIKDAQVKLVNADKLKKQMKKPWDWFEMAIDNLP
jgi:8-oxo-dGTP pyrophosphatase MutT (NUDIX family)